MPATTTAIGLVGERIAARWLIRRGWRIVDHHVRSRRGEIDLVARLGPLVAFVEVKTRSSVRFGDPLEFVGWRKQRRIFHTAQLWTAKHGCGQDIYRFDVIGVVACGDAFRVRAAEGAFHVDGFSAGQSPARRGNEDHMWITRAPP